MLALFLSFSISLFRPILGFCENYERASKACIRSCLGLGMKRQCLTVSKKKKEVKEENTRTLAMVLRSERELLGMNKKQEMEISQLKFMQCLRRRAQRSVTKFYYYFLDRRVAALSSLLYDSDTLVGKTLVYQKCNSNIK